MFNKTRGGISYIEDRTNQDVKPTWILFDFSLIIGKPKQHLTGQAHKGESKLKTTQRIYYHINSSH